MKSIINIAVFLFLILLVMYVGTQTLVKYDVNNNAQWDRLGNTIASISAEAWSFIRPFVQLVIILLIIEWLLGKTGVKIVPDALKFDWNVQTTIALLVVSAFCLAALGNIPGMGPLKDVALVVIGFYFGSHRKPTEGVVAEPQNK